MCVRQRGGGHGRSTEYAGHIIYQITWHTVFGGLEYTTDMTILICNACSTSHGSAVHDKRCMKAQWAHAAPALHTHRFSAAHTCGVKRE